MPLKRAPQLVPLSREHHEGLLLSWKIRQGARLAIDPKRVAAYVQWFWTNHLEDHFRREERAFHPALPGEPLLKRMQEEHEELEGLVHVNAQIADAALLEEIAAKLHDHIRFEERELFPLLEERLGAEKLDALQAIIDSKNAGSCAIWNDAFWDKA